MLTVTLNVLLLRRWSFIIIYLFIWLKRKKGVASNILDVSVAVAHAQTFTHSKCDFIFITPFKTRVANCFTSRENDTFIRLYHNRKQRRTQVVLQVDIFMLVTSFYSHVGSALILCVIMNSLPYRCVSAVF